MIKEYIFKTKVILLLFSFYEFFLFKCAIYFNLKVDVDDETVINAGVRKTKMTSKKMFDKIEELKIFI